MKANRVFIIIKILQSIDYTSIHSSDSTIDDNAKFCCTCIEKSHHTCITSYFQAWKSPQCPLTDPSLIRQPHPSVGHIMGTRLTPQAIHLTPQAIRLTPLATQCTHPWETCLIHQTMLPTLTSKMCRMQSVVYRQQADMFWYFQSVHDVNVLCTFYTF